MLAKLIAIAVVVWFYKSAKEVGENPFLWAFFGAVGFFLSATLAHYVISEPLLTTLPPKTTLASIIRQFPLFMGIASVYWIKRKNLIKQ